MIPLYLITGLSLARPKFNDADERTLKRMKFPFIATDFKIIENRYPQNLDKSYITFYNKYDKHVDKYWLLRYFQHQKLEDHFKYLI